MSQTWPVTLFDSSGLYFSSIQGRGNWEFYLASSYDLTQISRITGAADKKLSPIFNRPASFGCSLKIDSEAALFVEKWKHCVVIQDPSGNVVWSGPVTSIVDSAPGDTTAITAQGWQVEFDYRWIRSDQTDLTIFDTVNDGDIASTLVLLANSQADSNGDVRATHLTAVGTAAQSRTRTYTAGQNIGAALKELSDIENGYDISVDPLTRVISFIPNTSYADQTSVHYGYNMEPRNVASIVVNDDGTRKANSLIAQGAFTTGSADSPTDINKTGLMLEDWLTISDVKEDTIVGAYVNSELVYRVDGEISFNITPLQGSAQKLPFIDYALGDQVYLSADRGRIQFDHQPVRVFSATISWNAQGEPSVDSLGLAPS